MKAKIRKEAKKVYDYISQWEGPIYTFGNGGSCTIANHMAVDWFKNSDWKLEIHSLCANPAMLLMLANDYGAQYTCSYQLTPLVVNSLVILISSSGTSPNIVEAAHHAKYCGHEILGFTGFNGGALKKLSNVSVHIDSSDYGTVEDFHSNVMHEVARMLKCAPRS